MNTIKKISFSLIYLLLAVLVISKYLTTSIMEPTGYSLDIFSQIGFNNVLTHILIFLMLVFTLLFEKDKFRKNIIKLLIFLNYVLFLCFPRILGYYLTDRGDSLASIGFLKVILDSGIIDPYDVYPLSYIFSAFLNLVLGIKIVDTVFLFYICSTTILFLSIYLISSFILKKIGVKSNNELPILLSTTYWLGIYHTQFVGNFLAFCIEGIIIFISVKYILKDSQNDHINEIILLIILTIASIIAHPFVTAFNVILLLLVIIFKKKQDTLLYIYGVALILWASHTTLLKNALNSIFSTYSTKYSVFKQTQRLSEGSGLPFSLIIKYMSLRYSSTLAIYSITFMLIFLCVKQLKTNNLKKIINTNHHSLNESMFVGTFFILTNIFSALLFFTKHSYDRIIGLNMGIYGTILLYIYITKFTSQKVNRLIRLSSIIIPILSIFGLFLSPLVGFPYAGISNNEINGVNFMFENMGEDYRVVDPLGESKRYFMWKYGYFNSKNNKNLLYLCRVPDHFGYRDFESFKDNSHLVLFEHNTGFENKITYEYKNLIIPITPYFIKPYEEIDTYKSAGRYNSGDLIHYYSDQDVDIIYSGLDFKLTHVGP